MKTNEGSRFIKAVTLATAVALFLLLGGPAAAQPAFPPPAGSYTQTVQVDGVTVTVAGEDTEQGRADVDRVRDTMKNAIDKSKDMKAKVKDAGRQHGTNLTVLVGRNSRGVHMGASSTLKNLRTGQEFHVIQVDMADVAVVRDSLVPSPHKTREQQDADKQKVADAMLVDVLAHEIEHARDGPGQNRHKDPAGRRGERETGPAVDDANKVHEQLGDGVRRRYYGRIIGSGPTAFTLTTFEVNGQPVDMPVLEFLTEIRGERRFVPATGFEVDPEAILSIPDTPVPVTEERPQVEAPPGRGQAGTYPRPLASDRDLDGVANATDNCLGLANPQQADNDGDGVGQGCDLDDDNDGVLAEVERVSGSRDYNAQRTPEHWSRPETCSNGQDDDGDGFVDFGDMSCRAPAADTARLPQPLGAQFPDHLLLSRGGVPEGAVTLPVSGELLIDTNFNGTTEERLAVQGVLVMEHGTAGDSDGDGLADVTLEVTAADIGGTSPSLGPLRLFEQAAQDSSGRVEQRTAGASHYPADSSFRLFLDIRDPSGQPFLTVSSPLQLTGALAQWPPYGQRWTSSGIAVITNRQNANVAQIVGLDLMVATPPASPPLPAPLELAFGVNFVSYNGPTKPLPDGLSNVQGLVTAVFWFDTAAQAWSWFFPGVPSAVNTLLELAKGQIYVLIMDSGALWQPGP